MTSAIIGGFLFLGIATIVILYGKSQKRIGGLNVELKEDTEQRKRESDAKEIESKPAPNTSDDVADAWNRMRSDGSGKDR